MDSFDFLPDTLNKNLKIGLYVLICVHLLAFSLWMIATCPSLFKKSDSFNRKIEAELLKSKRE